MQNLLEPELIHLVNDDKEMFIVCRSSLLGAPELLTGKQLIKVKILGIIQRRVGIHLVRMGCSRKWAEDRIIKIRGENQEGMPLYCPQHCRNNGSIDSL